MTQPTSIYVRLVDGSYVRTSTSRPIPEGAVEVPREEAKAWFDAESEKFAERFRAKLDYAQLRKLEYPPITDYIDGLVKGDDAQVQNYIAQCRAVKAKYPKPESK